MNRILEAIEKHARLTPHNIALVTDSKNISYKQLVEKIHLLAGWLKEQDFQRIGLYGENSSAWIIADLAAWQAGVTLVPLPGFFSAEQLAHVEKTASLQMRLVCGEAALAEKNNVALIKSPLDAVAGITLKTSSAVSMPDDVCKITFTSGTTGNPKGVCLTSAAIERVTLALADTIYHSAQASRPIEQHLNILPLSTLLENIAGVYVPLFLGKTVIVLSGEKIGLLGSSQLSLPVLLGVLQRYQPNSLILLPQLLRALVAAKMQGHALPDSLRFVAVGGAHTAPELLRHARSLDIPVYEGYGLSECSSVVSLNNPSADCIGSVGKPLSHVDVQIKDGGIFVRGNVFSGYLDQPPMSADEWLDTGDLGYIDDEGFIHITGRRKNLLISSYGRNISPEWIESGLLLDPSIAQAIVVGDARPFCAAVLVLRNPDHVAVGVHIESINSSLPDYAQIKKYLVADEPFSIENGLLTDNGRMRRQAIIDRYQQPIDELYLSSPENVW